MARDGTDELPLDSLPSGWRSSGLAALAGAYISELADLNEFTWDDLPTAVVDAALADPDGATAAFVHAVAARDEFVPLPEEALSRLSSRLARVLLVDSRVRQLRARGIDYRMGVGERDNVFGSALALFAEGTLADRYVAPGGSRAVRLFALREGLGRGDAERDPSGRGYRI